MNARFFETRVTVGFVVLVVLGLIGCQTASAPPVRARVPEARTPVPTAIPVSVEPAPVPTRPPVAPVPAALETGDLDSPLIRVLLRRTSGTVDFPQPGRAYDFRCGNSRKWLWGPLEVGASARRDWQVGAFSDELSLRRAEERLRKSLGHRVALARSRTPEGLTRLRVEWREPVPVDPRSVLGELGFPEAFPVAVGTRVRVRDSAGNTGLCGSESILSPADEWPVVVGGRRYRGRFLLRPSGGEVLVINQLNLESYLRGVVPVEMGPFQFPELEALKAQAVAARTYAVSHLGDYEEDGYDICATPACQAYHGRGAEHRLSNRAVEETAGVVAVYEGAPIDAMYTSTCSGHTDAAADIFPDRTQPYLVAVPCAWERPLNLEGTEPSREWIDDHRLRASLAADLLRVHDGSYQSVQIVDQLARRAGRPLVGRKIGSADEFAAALVEAAGLDSAVLALTEGSTAVTRLVGLADLFDVSLRPPPAAWEDSWTLEAGFAVLELLGTVRRDSGEAVPHPEGIAIYPRHADRSEVLPQPMPLFEGWDGAVRSRRELTVYPGTRLERIREGDRVIALIARSDDGGGEADRRSSWRSWVRDRSFSEVARHVGIADLEKLEITKRTPHGRVIGLRAVGRGGRTKTWSGFDVRRALQLPENVFSIQVVSASDGGRRFRFLGRGWGHGVGLCQNGSYGLARAGMTYDRILATYYPGTGLATFTPSGIEIADAAKLP